MSYETEPALKAYLANNGRLEISARGLARSLLLKRRAFKHEAEIRLLHFGDAGNCDTRGLYRYPVDPPDMITQIMADPNRDRRGWKADRAAIAKATGFSGQIKRSKIYDPPGWDIPAFTS